MSIPVPRPPEKKLNAQKKTPKKTTRKAELKTFRCSHIGHSDKFVQAKDIFDAGILCQKKHGFYPHQVTEKKEYVRPDHLMDRPLRNHPGLEALKKTLS